MDYNQGFIIERKRGIRDTISIQESMDSPQQPNFTNIGEQNRQLIKNKKIAPKTKGKAICQICNNSNHTAIQR